MLCDEIKLGVIVPAHQAAGELPACLAALAAAGFAPGEILVVDDGSRDGTAASARARGVRVIRNERALGASEARNRGAAAVEADVLVFVDADVLVHRDVRERLVAAFADPEVAAVLGSYDDRPPAPGLVARYRNLLHHYVHQRSRREATTFWTGLGAVRREAFVALGGFDKAWENIEDSEFGVRLRRAGGRIRLDPDLQGTHLKAWTLRSMWRTDLKGRAIPWARLILFAGGPRDDLNMTGAHRVSAASVAAFGAALLLAALHPAWLVPAGFAVLAFVAANRNFLRFVAAGQGIGFALAAVPVHALHYLAGGLGLTWVLLTEGPPRLLSRRPQRADGEAPRC